MDVAHWIALLVLLVFAGATAWAFARSSGLATEFMSIGSLPWGRQILIDFYGLEVMLALFMVSHAAASGTWLALIVCLVLMPFLGAGAAAAYWLAAV